MGGSYWRLACVVLIFLPTQILAAGEQQRSRHWGVSVGASLGSGNELEPQDGARKISHDVFGGSVGALFRAGQPRAFFSYQLGVDLVLGRFDLKASGASPPTEQPTQPEEQPSDPGDDDSLLGDIIDLIDGGDDGDGGGGDQPTGSPPPAGIKDQEYKGIMTSHGFLFRPQNGRMAWGVTLYVGRLYATSPDFEGDAGSYPLGLGASVVYDGQNNPESGMPSFELTVRELRALELEQGSDEPSMRQAELMLRASWFF